MPSTKKTVSVPAIKKKAVVHVKKKVTDRSTLTGPTIKRKAVHVKKKTVDRRNPAAKALSEQPVSPSKNIRKSKYKIDLAAVAASVNISECVSLVLV